jgi:hypothetical protein
METGSRAPYHHLLTLYDADGVVISPEDMPPEPYSPQMTCGKCHDYSAISSGFHFNTTLEGTAPGRIAQPWFLADQETGTQLPLSYRPWPGVHHPDRVGMSQWDFVQHFGRHLPGGDMGQRDVDQDPDPEARWEISGEFQIDCLACHAKGAHHDQAQREPQIEAQNLKWIPTATAGLATVRGAAAKLPDDFDPFMPPDFDSSGGGGPMLTYDPTRFNSDERTFMDLTRRPETARCYFCHTYREVGGNAPEQWQADHDIHLRSGLSCTDCHRNGLDHQLVRGYEGEPRSDTDPAVESASCRGCHYGGNAGGRHGAPYPPHYGLPAFHLETMSCTAWPSGPTMGHQLSRVQSSRAHALGIMEKERSPHLLPVVVTPVLTPEESGVLTPKRFVSPAFWVAADDEGILSPLHPEKVRPFLAERESDAEGEDLVHERPLTLSQVEQTLVAMAGSGDLKAPGYVTAGRLLRVGDRGGLEELEHESAAPVYWAIGHDVRPGAQALGAGTRSCLECHAADSAFLSARVTPPSTVDGVEGAVRSRAELMGVNVSLMRAWSFTLWLRPLYIGLCLLSVGVLGAMLVHYAFVTLADLPRSPAAR